METRSSRKKYRDDFGEELTEQDRKQIDFPIFGLCNPPRTQNCFINSVIQSFWMIDTFRHFFSWYSSMNSANDDAFIQELKCFFREILKTQKNVFDNNLKSFYLKDLRLELSKMENYSEHFQIGYM